MRATPDVDEGVLHDFLRFHFIDEHPNEERINESTATAVKTRERLLVALGNQHQQARVFTRLGIRQFSGLVLARKPQRLIFSGHHAQLGSILAL